MKRFLQLLSPLIAIVVFSAASWALYKELQNYHWREFRESLNAIPLSRVASAVLLAALDYAILIGNDWLASRFLGRRVPLGKLAMGSLAGYAASHNLGAAFGGTPVRYRFYASWGVPPAEIAAWIAMLTVSFAVGASTTGGVACLLHPMTPPEDLPLPIGNARYLGVVLIAVPIGYLASCALLTKPLRWRNRSIRLPAPRLAAVQIAVGAADLCCAAGILYLLLPPGAAISYAAFLSVYLMAIVGAVCSHVPGGVGVFDLIMIKLLNHGDPHGMLAALLVYRTVYYLLPLVVGLVFFAAHELRLRNTP
jgi:uncharacterized membrane protein YbhN (UPF0104 family)